MSKILESAIRNLLFEQNATQKITMGSTEDKEAALAAGAVDSFKITSIETDDAVVNDMNSADVSKIFRIGTTPKDTSVATNLARMYQSNILGSAKQLIPKSRYKKYLKGKHIILMGNTPVNKTTFSVRFWIFDIKDFYEFSKYRDKDKQLELDKLMSKSKNIETVLLNIKDSSPFRIKKTPVYTYDQYIQKFITTNNSLQNINQGVDKDVITVFREETTSKAREIIESDKWPKILNGTAYALNTETDEVVGVPKLSKTVDINSNIEYLIFDRDSWLNYIKSINGYAPSEYDSTNVDVKEIYHPWQTTPGCNLRGPGWTRVYELDKLFSDLPADQVTRFDVDKYDREFVEGMYTKRLSIYQQLVDQQYNAIIKELETYVSDTNQIIWQGIWYQAFGNWQKFYQALIDHIGDIDKWKLLIGKNKKNEWVWRNDAAKTVFREAGIQLRDMLLAAYPKDQLPIYQNAKKISNEKIQVVCKDTGEYSYEFNKAKIQQDIQSYLYPIFYLKDNKPAQEAYFDIIEDKLNQNKSLFNK